MCLNYLKTRNNIEGSNGKFCKIVFESNLSEILCLITSLVMHNTSNVQKEDFLLKIGERNNEEAAKYNVSMTEKSEAEVVYKLLEGMIGI